MVKKIQFRVYTSSGYPKYLAVLLSRKCSGVIILVGDKSQKTLIALHKQHFTNQIESRLNIKEISIQRECHEHHNHIQETYSTSPIS